MRKQVRSPQQSVCTRIFIIDNFAGRCFLLSELKTQLFLLICALLNRLYKILPVDTTDDNVVHDGVEGDGHSRTDPESTHLHTHFECAYVRDGDAEGEICDARDDGAEGLLARGADD